VLERSLDLSLVDTLGQLEGPVEGAVRALDEVPAPLLVVLAALRPLVPADGENAVLRGHLDLLRRDAGQLDLEHQGVLVLPNVDRGRPAPLRAVAPHHVLEEPVDVPAKREERGDGSPVQHRFVLL
jgi:hypothetical protein